MNNLDFDSLSHLAKKFRTERFTENTLVSNTPILIASITVEPDDETVLFQVPLYDGQGVHDREVYYLRGRYTNTHYNFDIPVHFERGLFVGAFTNANAVVIQFANA